MRILLLSLLVSLTTFPAFSAWLLDNQFSKLSFVTIKKGDIAENHHFARLAGKVNKSGKVNFTVDLTSVDTKIAIRDDRMKQFLFNTDKFPKANFKAKLDMQKIDKLASGKTLLMPLTGSISLHGQKQEVSTQVLVAKLSKDKFVVSSMQPVLINAKNYDLVAGVAKLRELAGLPSISNAVPVSFVLSFNQAQTG
ncbi:YceI family protein [Thalassomonas haliotis]|uniref:YceI family protein n=1 Tax=Thalassomonas haliotis TaxID=485448 RepID=A0ABY7VFE7_9GAMM|nr:YceI family protein [Thalassomonas haliotis]WDE11618.1 YceI family protein [Thalassomonas haliotis]